MKLLLKPISFLIEFWWAAVPLVLWLCAMVLRFIPSTKWLWTPLIIVAVVSFVVCFVIHKVPIRRERNPKQLGIPIDLV